MVGAKAARLALARQSGLPVLAGFVVTASSSRDHLRLGAETLPTRGSGGARLAVTGRPLELAASLIEAGVRLSPHLVARSSTLLESSGEWAGAFTSYVDITPEQLPKAVAGCWASAYSVDALGRQDAAGVPPGSFPMAVLVQPALEPEWGGAAELRTDGDSLVHVVAGSPAPLLQGSVAGDTSRRSDDGAWDGAPVTGIGVDLLEEIHQIMLRAHHLLGANRCEWAAAGGKIWLLQLDTVVRRDDIVIATVGGTHDEWLPVVRTLLDAPGRLGSELVLPWAMKEIPEAAPRTGVRPDDVDEAIRLSRMLTSQVWGRDPESAQRAAQACLNGLLGPEPERSLETMSGLQSPDPELARRLIGLVHGLREAAGSNGAVGSAAEAWYLGTEDLAAALRGDRTFLRPRIGPTRWEPLVAAVVLTHGTRLQGFSASPGLGAGRVEVISPAGSPRSPTPRSVLYAQQALPVLSQILWDAGGVITNGGSPAAHLFESARSLGVAAVTGVELPTQEGSIVAVDGFAGVVAFFDG